MADRELKYTFHSKNAADDSIVTYSSLDNAKACVGFDSNWDFSKGSPSWSLAESNTRLVLTWVFTDAQADDQLAVHEAIKDATWKNTARKTATNKLLSKGLDFTVEVLGVAPKASALTMKSNIISLLKKSGRKVINYSA